MINNLDLNNDGKVVTSWLWTIRRETAMCASVAMNAHEDQDVAVIIVASDGSVIVRLSAMKRCMERLYHWPNYQTPNPDMKY